jgi:hypothetical protein
MMMMMSKTFTVLIVCFIFSFFFVSKAPAPPSCDDGNPCTIDFYDWNQWKCVNQPVICDDGDRCTDDSCDPAKGCVYTPNDVCVEECPPANPKTQGYWQHQCRALGLIGTSQGNPRLQEGWMAELSDIEEICAKLDANPNDMCSKANKQLQALKLNLMSERLADCNCIMPEGTVGEAVGMIEDLIADLECIEANELADNINTGKILIECP